MKTICFSLATLALVACHTHEKESSPPSTRAVMMMSPPPISEASSRYASHDDVPSVQKDRALIREARLVMEVRHIKHTSDTVKRLLQQHHAYAENERQEIDGRGLHRTLLIRVSDKEFEPLLQQIEVLGDRITDRLITTEDVTLEFTDLQARLKAKKALEMRYHEILKQAKTVKDMLAIEEQLGTTREAIESMEAEYKLMDNRIAYCTIDVTLTEKTIAPPTGFAQELNMALTDGWKGLTGLLLSTVSRWPWIVLLATMAGLIVRYLRGRSVEHAA